MANYNNPRRVATQEEKLRSDTTFGRSTGVVKEYPVSSMLVVFGIGIGVGALLGSTLAAPIMSAIKSEPSTAEKLGTQIYAALANTIPSSIMRRLPG